MDLVLDPQTLGNIHRALCDAFPQPEELKQFAKYRLGISLVELAGDVNLRVLADKLLDEVSASNKRTYLLRQACRAQPGAPGLRKLEKQLLPHFSTEQLEALDKLLPSPQPGPRSLETLAEEGAPQGWMFPVPVANEGAPMAFSRLVDSLSSASTPASGPHPLHGFIARLAARFPGAAVALKQWIRDTGGQVQPGPAADKVSALRLFVKCDSGVRDTLVPGDAITVTAWPLASSRLDSMRAASTARPGNDVTDTARPRCATLSWIISSRWSRVNIPLGFDGLCIAAMVTSPNSSSACSITSR